MPVVDFSFMQFVILVLPGFWALWIYKPFILKGNVTEHWENDLTLALMFGFVGYIAAGISSKYFGWTSGIIMLFVSVISSLLIAVIMGFLARKNKYPSYWPSYWAYKSDGKEEDRPHERALEHLLQEFVYTQTDMKDRFRLLRIYKLGYIQNAEIRILKFKSIQHNEIGIDYYPRITSKDIEDNQDRFSIWTKIINLDSGIVVEVADVEKEWILYLINEQEKELRATFSRQS
jgi:hypothetical protein